MILFLIYFSLLGLIVGSFLNVYILRYNTGKSLAGRSGCFSCGHKLSWRELFPVVSFLFLRGRCKHCGSKISWQYPAVEVLTAVLFALSAWKFYPNILAIAFYATVSALLMVLVAYDFRHKIIAQGPVYLLIFLSVLSPLFSLSSAKDFILLPGVLLMHLLGGIVLFLFFFSLWYFSEGRWMGLGDSKLALAIGFLLGLVNGVNAVVLAFWIGAPVGLLLVGLSKLKNIKSFYFLRRRFSIKSELPFAPFLVLGLLLNLFWGITIFVF